jgi:hypothetical protein
VTADRYGQMESIVGLVGSGLVAVLVEPQAGECDTCTHEGDSAHAMSGQSLSAASGASGETTTLALGCEQISAVRRHHVKC